MAELPYARVNPIAPIEKQREGLDLDIIRRFIENMGKEQLKDVAALGRTALRGPMQGMVTSGPMAADPEDLRRSAAAVGGIFAGGAAGKVGALAARPILRGALSGAASGATDAGIRTGGDIPSMAGGTALGAIVGGVGGKYHQQPGTLEQKNPFESTRRTLQAMGEPGKRIAEVMERMQNRANVNAGTAVHAYTEVGLDKLSPADDAAVGLALRGKIAPERLSPQAKAAFDVADAHRRSVAERSSALGLKVMNKEGARAKFVPRSNYFPGHAPPTDQLRRGPVRDDAIANAVAMGDYPNREAATQSLDSYLEFVDNGGRSGGEKYLENLVKRGFAKNVDSARGMLMRFMQRPQSERFGNLERRREFDFEFYDPSPKRVLVNYAENAEKRLAEAEHLGQDMERVGALLGDVPIQDRPLMQSILQSALEAKRKGDPRLWKLFGFGRKLSSLKLSPTSAVKNLGQNLNTLFVTDIGSTAGGIKDAFTKAGRTLAEESGSTTEGALRHSQHMVGADSEWLRKYLTGIGFTGSEKFNRTVAANASARYAAKMVARLQKNAGDAFAAAELRRLQIDPESITPQTILSPQERRIAAQAGVNRTQFNSTALDLPPMVQNDPWVNSAAQYKTYPYQQAQMIRSEFVDRLLSAAPGDRQRAIRNLVLAGTIAPAAGEGINNLLAAATGRKRKTEGIKRYLDDALAPTGVGILSDVMSSLDYNPLEYIVGPTIGTAAKTAQTTKRIIDSGKVTPSQGRFLLRQVPTVGPLFAERVIPREDSTKAKAKNPRKARKENKR